LVEREYSCLDDVKSAGLIIDFGANVGYSSAYFLSRFPGSELIAVEPDPENLGLLCSNLSPFGDRARPLHTAVWSHPTRLAMEETKYRGGLEWSRQVRECTSASVVGLQAVDIASLLEGSKHDRISILKIDIEGAEAVEFSQNYESWIGRFDILVIEVHDDSNFGRASDVLARSIEGRGLEVSYHRELTVCKRRVGSPQPVGCENAEKRSQTTGAMQHK
jgi:FkbM family methyltransferase